jgi:uncharacterized membrane protein YkvI
VIETGAGLVVLWLVTGERLSSHRAERRAQQLIAASFLMLSVYVTIESFRDLIGQHHPAVSWVGVALAAVTLIAMPPLAAAKRRLFLSAGERQPALFAGVGFRSSQQAAIAA